MRHRGTAATWLRPGVDASHLPQGGEARVKVTVLWEVGIPGSNFGWIREGKWEGAGGH